MLIEESFLDECLIESCQEINAQKGSQKRIPLTFHETYATHTLKELTICAACFTQANFNAKAAASSLDYPLSRRIAKGLDLKIIRGRPATTSKKD